MTTTSKHLAIRAAVAALFLAAPALAGGRVFENRQYALGEGVASQIHVNRIESDPNADQVATGMPVDWTTTIEVLILARQDGNTEAEVVADAIWTALYARLMAGQGLGGLAMGLVPGLASFEQATADSDVASVTWRFTVLHRTTANAIS